MGLNDRHQAEPVTSPTLNSEEAPNSNSDGGEIFDKTSDGGVTTVGPDLWIDPSAGNRLYFAQGFDGGVVFTGVWYADNVIRLGEWQHVVVVYSRQSSSNVPVFYVNGVQKTAVEEWTPGGNAKDDSGEDAVIGVYGAAIGQSGFFEGSIDEVRVYSRALGAAEIAALAKSGAVKVNASSADLDNGTTLNTGLVGHWTFDGPDVTTVVTDRSGQNNHGYFNGGATSSAKVIGKLGQALVFDGINNLVSMPPTETLLEGASALTLSAWVNVQSLGEGELVAGRYDGGATGWGIKTSFGGLRDSDDFLVFLTGNDYGYTTSNAVRAGSWRHVAMVFDGTQTGNDRLKFYIDGSAESLSYNGNMPATANGGTSLFSVGAYHNGANYLNSRIDDVRLYNRALTAAEIKKLYGLGSAVIRP